MERMDALLDTIATAKRAEFIAANPNTTPENSCERAEISPGCRVKNGDDVLVNGIVGRVICPYELNGWFYALIIDGMQIVPTPFEAQYITDRAPADPEEEPLPIFEEPPP